MAKVVLAREVVGTEFPTVEGARLADVLLAAPTTEWADRVVDLRGIPASLLISAFFNSFLLRVFQTDPTLLDVAKGTKWELAFDFQRENVEKWMAEYTPQAARPATATA